MSLPITIPVSARPYITANIFSAVFNAPTINRYDFTNIAGNQRQNLITLKGDSVYIIERTCFSLNIPEGVFQESIDSAATVPVLKIETRKTGQLIFPRKQPFINYLDNLELLLFVPGDQAGDEILISFEAVLFQVPATVGVLVLRAFVQFNIYEIQNSAWVERFTGQNPEAIGDLLLRGARRVPRQTINGGNF